MKKIQNNRIFTVYFRKNSDLIIIMQTINITFSRTLRQLRKANKLTQEQLAHLAGIDYKYLQKLEGNNPSSPTLSTMAKLCKGLNISLTDFAALIDKNSR